MAIILGAREPLTRYSASDRLRNAGQHIIFEKASCESLLLQGVALSSKGGERWFLLLGRGGLLCRCC
jgi:hypothetical protein